MRERRTHRERTRNKSRTNADCRVKVWREEKEACTVSKNAGTYCAAANRGSVVSGLSCKEKETERKRGRERETLSPEKTIKAILTRLYLNQ